MAKARFVFASISEENNQKKVGLYFENEAGDILEIKWGNEDYINEHLKKFGLKSIDELENYLTKNPEQEVYEYSYTDKDKKKHEGYSLDKPFPTASEAKQAIVTGKVIEAVDNGSKVAVKVSDKKGEFTVVRGYSVFDEKNKRMYPVKAKKDKLFDMLNVEKDVSELVGTEITFVRQKAGNNFYYDAEED